MSAVFNRFHRDQLQAREEELNLLLDDMTRDPVAERDKIWQRERQCYLDELCQNLRQQDRLNGVEKS